ncbi:hypothetical protein QQX98_008082 [Neonectria punicea]|uniref:DUF7918 domain-containing protein n=1 Tax=Neonectria punicea TaxID=979145 RepID=A0ABR1GWN3_9HYPO
MAVLPGVPGLSVNIRVAGEIATEYQDAHDDNAADVDDTSTRCYIESKAGAEFAIELTVTPEYRLGGRYNGLAEFPSIDGKTTSGKCLFLGDQRAKAETIVQTGATMGSDVPNMAKFGNFVFIPITSNDESQALPSRNSELAKSLGTISVRVKACNFTGELGDFPWSTFDTQKSLSIHEKLMKGKDLSHGSSISDGRLINRPKTNVFAESETIGTYNFYPRSHDALKSRMLIPRSRPPSPLSPGADDTLGSLSDAEIRRLARERLRDVKIESSVSVKRESESTPQPVRPLKVIKLQDGTEAFDLTED